MFSKLSSWSTRLQLIILALLMILPTVSVLSQIDTVDILPPRVIINSGCGEFAVAVTDNRSFQLNADTFNLDAGISNEPIFFTTRSTNISGITLNPDFEHGKKNKQFSFRMTVEDKYKEAFGLFAVYDDAEPSNSTFDSVRYVPELLELAPAFLGFGNVFIGKSAQLEARVSNISDFPIDIKKISLKFGTVFSIISIEPDKRLLQPKESIRIRIEYNPSDDLETADYDVDSLFVETSCLHFSVSMFGIGVKPSIQVDDIDFGAIPIGSKSCNDVLPYAPGVRIYNQGTGQLMIGGFIPPKADGPYYVLETMNPPIKGMTILPKSEVHFTTICFEPTQPGEFFDEVAFMSNASGPDSIYKLRGIAYYPGVHFQDVNFGALRVGDTLEKFIVIRNDGDLPIDLTNVLLDKSTIEYRILSQKVPNFPTFDKPVRIFPKGTSETGKITELIIPVQYTPVNEGYTEMRVNLEVSVQGNKSIAMFNYVRGYAYLPKIFAKGYEFSERTLVNNVNPDTGFVYIRSFSETADLKIRKIIIEKTNLPGINDFIFLESLPNDIVLSRNTDLRLPVIFRPEGAGKRSVKVIIYHDAYSGKSDPLRFDTTVVYLHGEGYNKVLAFDNLLFDDVIHCMESSAKLTLRNISADKEAFLMDMRIISGDAGSFKVDVSKIIDDFVILQPGESFDIDVTFHPDVYYKNYFEILVRVFADVDTATAIVKASTKKYSMEVKLDTLNNVVPGMLTLLRDRMPLNREFPISVLSDDLAELGIRKFEINLKFGKNDLKYFNQVERGVGIIDWHTLDAELLQFDDEHNLLRIWGEGETDLTYGENVIKPGFIVMLGDSGTIDIDILDATFFFADSCAIYKFYPGQMNMSYCGSEIRNIIIASHFYDLWTEQIVSRTKGDASLKYTIAIEAHTEIIIYNSAGELVEVVDDKVLKQGSYIHQIDLTNYSGGMYFVTMKSGPFLATRKFFVVN